MHWHPLELQPIAVYEVLGKQIFKLQHLQTFTQVFMSIIYKSLVLKFIKKLAKRDRNNSNNSNEIKPE